VSAHASGSTERKNLIAGPRLRRSRAGSEYHLHRDREQTEPIDGRSFGSRWQEASPTRRIWRTLALFLSRFFASATLVLLSRSDEPDRVCGFVGRT
jgi:hypothetical protein